MAPENRSDIRRDGGSGGRAMQVPDGIADMRVQKPSGQGDSAFLLDCGDFLPWASLALRVRFAAGTTCGYQT